jgi:hypothetical protein
MNKAVTSLILLTFFTGQVVAPSYARAEAFSEERAEQIRQTAITAFIQHKYNRCYHLFGDFCRHFPGDSNKLKITLDQSFEDLQVKVQDRPKKLKQLRGYLDGLLGLRTYSELRALTDPEPLQSK